MSNNENNSQVSESTTYGTIGLLANHHPLAADPKESEQPEPKPNEITANIIKDASKVANQVNDDLDDEDIQRKMNGLINDLQSESIIPDDNHSHPRKSITSNHLIDNQENSSTPAIIDSSSDNLPQGPIRSMSESTLIDHHETTELPPTLPIQQDESSTDDDDDDNDDVPINATNRTFDNNQAPSNIIQQNSFGEAPRVGTTSRTESASSKRSPSTSGDEKRVQLPDETGTDTDRDNQEVTNITRRSSDSKSPLNRPRAPTPDDSRQTLTNGDTKRPPSSSLNEQKQHYELPTAVISPASRRESTNKTEQRSPSRPSSAVKSKFNDHSFVSSTDQSSSDFSTTNEQSKLVKPGEQLQIPTNEMGHGPINSPPPSPAITKQMVLTNPLLGSSLTKTDQDHSRPPSQTNRKSPTSSSISNAKMIDGDIIPSKSGPSSNTSQQQTTTVDQKSDSILNRQGSHASENDPKEQTRNRKDSSSSSTDTDASSQTSAKQKQERILSTHQRPSSLRKRSGEQSTKNSNPRTDQTVVSPIKVDSAKARQQNEKRLSTASSDNEQINTSKLPRLNSSSSSTTVTGDKQSTSWMKQIPVPPIQTTDDEIPLVRPQSPNVEQIAERNQLSPANRKRNTDEQKKKDQNRSLRHSNSAESFNHIPLVDDKSLDSASGTNTESERPKQRRVKSKKTDVETNTDSRNGNYQQQELTAQKTLKAGKPMSNHSPSIRRHLPTKEQNVTTPDIESDSNTHIIRRSIKKSQDSNENKDPVNVNVTVLVKNINNEDDSEVSQKPNDEQKVLKIKADHERHTQSDTEQLVNEKQKKRRRPKRISRTTQTYECVFRRMEREQHEELRPTSETDKNIQTRKSCLRPRTRSPKRHYPIYLSADAFKIEEILPKQFSQNQRNTPKSSAVARSTSPQSGKLLILRPTLPFHHTDAVNVQRISLQYAIDLIPNDNKSNASTSAHRNKSYTPKQSEQTNNLPIIRSSSSTVTAPTNKSNTKDKAYPNRIEDRTYQRKNGGNV